MEILARLHLVHGEIVLWDCVGEGAEQKSCLQGV